MTDTTTQTPELCADCISGHLKSGTPTGAEIKVGGFDTYVATPSQEPTAAVVVLHDAFGWKFANNRLLADEIAKEGYLCLLPDLFDGDLMPLDQIPSPNAPRPPGPPPKAILEFIGRHNSSVTILLIDRVLNGLREQYPSVRKVGATGYCWGGKYSILVGSRPDQIAAVVMTHPSLVDVEEVKAIAVPSLWCCAETDYVFNSELRAQCEEIIRGKVGVETRWEVYEGTSHGFAIRCDEKDVKAQKASTKALNDMKEFFAKHLAA